MTQPFVPTTDPSTWAIGTANDAGGNGVAMAHLMGRTVAIVPLQFLENQPSRQDPTKFQNVVVADIFILNGPTFTFGGSPDGKPMPTPDTMQAASLPFLAENCRIYGVVITDQLRSKVRNGVAVGRVVKERTGTGNYAWQLTTDPTPQDLQLVTQLVNAHYQQRSFVNPAVHMIAGAPQQAPQFNQQPAVYPQGFGGQAAPVQNPSSPNPTMPAFTAPAQPAAPFNFAALAAPAAPPAAPVDWTLTKMPASIPLEHAQAWQTQTTLAQREQMLAAAGDAVVSLPQASQPTGL